MNKKKYVGILCMLVCFFFFVPMTGTAYAEEGRAHIVVTCRGKTYAYTDALLPCPNHMIYEQIERRKINAPLEEKMRTVEKCLAAGADLQSAFDYCFPLLTPFIESIEKAFNLPAQESKISFDPTASPKFTIAREKEGRALDRDALYRDLYIALRRSTDVRIEGAVKAVQPLVTARDNVRLTNCISSFSTDFSSSGEGRKNNIRLALRHINGKTIPAGETFSFNAAVGARSEQNGFLPAKIIMDGKYVDGIGGGVCQVSTTLYNAALRAGMSVLAVRGHSILPSYVPPSLDAMVSGSGCDLKFMNPFDTPVFIAASSEGDRATVRFYGAPLGYRIEPYSRELSRGKVPPDREVVDEERTYTEGLPAGEKVRVSYGHAAVKSESFLRYFTLSGTFMKEERIRTDSYIQTEGLVAISPQVEPERVPL